MNKCLPKITKIINKIGKPNFILIVFIFIILGITSLYQTFSLYTISEEVSILDGIKTYKFLLSNKEENTVIIAANSNKKLMITIENPEKINLKYGIYYVTSNYNDIDIGYLSSSEYPAVGIIEAESNYIITIQVDNFSNEEISVQFGLTYGFPKGGKLEKEQNQYWVEEKIEPFPLNTVAPGSYVAYEASNGCNGNSCSGQNANYISDEDMGYCYSQNDKFTKNGWRVGYIKNNTAYLISAGSPECLATDETGNIIQNGNASTYDTTEGATNHIKNSNYIAMKYCNSNYAYNGECNSSSAWSINTTDFEAITGSSLSSCSGVQNSSSCGYNNDLIDNGSFYYFSTISDNTKAVYGWYPSEQKISIFYSNALGAIRPVLRLSSKVMVVSGDGTYQKPYRLKNEEDNLSEKKAGDYVAYIGNNGCSSKTCKGWNANYVNDSSKGYCLTNSDYQFTTNGWRIGYLNSEIPYLISGGSPECFCTNSAGEKVCGTQESTIGVPLHVANLNNTALNYCNATYAYNNQCSSATTWNLNANDFEQITGSKLYYNSSSDNSCMNTSQSTACGYNNDLIDNGSFYWFASTPSISSGSGGAFLYTGFNRNIGSYGTGNMAGVRPIIKLKPKTKIRNGAGTYQDPYKIYADNTKITDLSGNNHFGIINNATINRTDGTITTSGDVSYVDCGLENYNFGKNITFAIRVKIHQLTGNSQNNCLIGNWENGGGGLGIIDNSLFLQLHLFENGSSSYKTLYVNYTPELEKWITIVGTYDGSSLSVYVNGTKRTINSSISGSIEAVSGNITLSPMPFYIAANPEPNSDSSSYMKATYDSVLIFNRTLSSEEIAADYSAEINPTNKEKLLLYYDFK